MAVLPTNYLDDILAASMGGKRRFRITHEDGSTEEVTLEDVSEYEQAGSPFGSGDVNKTNQAVNEKLDSADVVDPALATVLGFAADAKLTGDALSELTKNFEDIEYAEKRYAINKYESYSLSNAIVRVLDDEYPSFIGILNVAIKTTNGTYVLIGRASFKQFAGIAINISATIHEMFSVFRNASSTTVVLKAVATTPNIIQYSDVAQIGLTTSNATAEKICSALSNHSMLSVPMWKDSWTSFNFPTNVGSYMSLIFIKQGDSYASMELYDLSNNKKYLSAFNGGTKIWSSWSALN